MRRRAARVRSKWEDKGWEYEQQSDRRFRTTLHLARTRRRPRWGLRIGGSALALLLISGLVLAGVHYLPLHRSPGAQARADAATAIRALHDGDLPALEQQLAADRGNPDFAYFFASKTDPRALGDALASVAASSGDGGLKPDVEPNAYDLTLTDLAGTLGLATHFHGKRALPATWSDDFALATTRPDNLYGAADDGDDAAQQRAEQDRANKQNLLLLLSRGYWSLDFLQKITTAYWDFDHDKGDDAWPGATLDDPNYAPAPNGKYLTDGLLALTAALTANPEASAWAFSDFQPGTVTVDYGDGDRAIGEFTHYLFFEHQFPAGSHEGSVGMTASLTALSSAIDADPGDASDAGSGPQADALVLHAMANKAADRGGDSLVSKAWKLTKRAAGAVWHWLTQAVQRWGHPALTLLSLFPNPYVQIPAAAANAIWYAIDGDWAEAGLSAAIVVAGPVGKLAGAAKVMKAAKLGGEATKSIEGTSAGEALLVRAAKAWRYITKTKPAADVAKYRVQLRQSTKAKIFEGAPRASDGRFVDANSGLPIDGTPHIGHKPGYEWRCIKAAARREGWTRAQLIAFANDPDHYQVEDPRSNMSHQYEADTCAI